MEKLEEIKQIAKTEIQSFYVSTIDSLKSIGIKDSEAREITIGLFKYVLGLEDLNGVLTSKEVSILLRCTQRYISTLVKVKKIKPVSILENGSLLFSLRDIEMYLKEKEPKQILKSIKIENLRVKKLERIKKLQEELKQLDK